MEIGEVSIIWVWNFLKGFLFALAFYIPSIASAAAGFQNISNEILEAGRIDGINGVFQELWYLNLFGVN